MPRTTKAVKTVTAKTFDKVVNNTKKDVLIEFFAPWCGHCRSLEPIYETLAQTLSHEKDIVVCKMDGSAHEIPPPYEVTGYPTIYFAPKFDKENPLIFKGNRGLEQLITFVAREATEELEAYDRNGKPI